MWDVIVIGTGISGLFTALNIDEKFKVLVICKSQINKGNSYLAQGGIVYCKNPEVHFKDTLKAGSYYNNKKAVKILEEESILNINKLIDFGVDFDRDINGNLKFTREGGHSENTILHVKDKTGIEIMSVLVDKIKSKKNIVIKENTFAMDLILKNDELLGLKVIEDNGIINIYNARTIVLATGGIGKVYKNTTNSVEITGDGIAMAYRAGAHIIDMEFVQFHPTALYTDKSEERFLISEAVRGEGAILKNEHGKAFMKDYHESGDLAPRDIVSRSIFNEIKGTDKDYVYLDITHKSSSFIKKRFPTIYEKCLKENINIVKDMIPVSPSEHYLMGGIYTDLYGRTNIKGLYACGECACTGVHGANRLASNSLLEGIVFGNRIASHINETLILSSEYKEKNKYENKEKVFVLSNKDNIDILKKLCIIEEELNEVMENYVGIIRSKEELKIALDVVEKLKARIENINSRSFKYFEVLNMITVSILIIKGALGRNKSLGAHYIDKV